MDHRSEEPKRTFNSPKPFAIGLLIGGLVVFGLWYFFFTSSHVPDGQPIPFIAADRSPVKIRPENSAQPEVPHKDKLIYSRVNPAELKGTVERLLPLPEDPIDPATLIPAVETPPQPRHVETIIEHDFEPEEATGETSIDIDVFPAIAAEPSKQTAIKVQVIPTRKATPPTKNALAPKPAPIPTKKGLRNGYRLQLASMRSPELAKREWNRLKTKYRGVFNALTPHFSRVDLGAKKGIYYRVQAGDFVSKAKAENICRHIKNKNPKAGCLVVRF